MYTKMAHADNLLANFTFLRAVFAFPHLAAMSVVIVYCIRTTHNDRGKKTISALTLHSFNHVITLINEVLSKLSNLTFVVPCIVIYFYSKNQPGAQYLKFILFWNNAVWKNRPKYIECYVILFSNLMHNFFIKSIVYLYMFRAILCSSSGGLNCIYTASGS